MKNFIVLILALLPIAANASCSVSLSGDALTLYVEKSSTCLNTQETRDAFKSSITLALADTSNQKSSRSTINRSTSAQKLYNFADLEKQRQHLNPGAKVYYGQR